MTDTNHSTGGEPVPGELISHFRSITRWWSAVSNGLLSGDYTNFRVLIVDDEPFVCELLIRSVMNRLGCQVQTAHRGDEAMERLEAQNYEVLITDMVMPGLNGMDLIRAVRRQFPDVAIIVMTGFPDNFPFVDVIRAGANDFIVKPHPPQELEAKLIRIFEERRLRDAQVLAEAKYRSLFEWSMEGMALIDPEKAQLVDLNQAFAKLCGRPRADLTGANIRELLRAADAERIECGLRHCASEGQSALADLGLANAEGRDVSIDASFSYIAAPGQRYVLLVAKDMTEKRELERHLADAAERDEVTGLSNKRRFRNRIEWAVTQAVQEEMPLTLFLMDLDNFKQCNDTYGHQTGDELLRQVGRIVRESIRARTDEGFRFGGDEFAIILYGANVTVASRVAERVRAEFAACNTYGTTMSIGIAEYARPLSSSEFIKRTDEALYAAKSSGKNAIVVA